MYSERQPDKVILKKVNQRVTRTGTGSQSNIKVGVRNGVVTISGTIEHEGQRRHILKAARGAGEAGRVVDQLQVKSRKR
jgi:osmotically-inducible protein OsmY